MLLRLVVLFALLVGALPEKDARAAVPMKAGTPDKVEIGVWLAGIHNIDFLNGSYGTEFYLWWVSANPDFKPFDSFQIVNGRDWKFRSVNRRRLKDGSIHTSAIVSATVNHNWDLGYYPFDRQNLRIVFETPFTSEELRLTPNNQQSIVGEHVEVEGFRIAGLWIDEHIESYNTDFGFRDGGGHRFSRATVTVNLERQSERLAVVLLLGFIVANLIALFTYAIEVSMIGTRAAMITAAMFGAIGNMALVSDEVNPADGSVIVDGFALGTFASILLALLIGIVVHRLFLWNKVRTARIVNWSTLAVVLVASGFYYRTIFNVAMQSG